MGEAYNAGATAFINLMPFPDDYTMAQLAAGSLDGSLYAWADAVRAWLVGGPNRTVFIAPFLK